MALSTFDRQLRLLETLAGNRTLTVEQLAERLDIGPRQVYRYIKEFQEAGFEVVHSGTVYRVLPTSDFFQKITEGTYFTPDEAEVLLQIVQSAVNPTPQMRHLQNKLEAVIQNRELLPSEFDERAEQNLRHIYKAMKEGRQVRIVGYQSLHSQTVADRVVEPFFLMAGNADVRCYEPASKMNKTFRLTRMDRVEVLTTLWEYESEHRTATTDIFGYTSDAPTTVTLWLTHRAWLLLREEFPVAHVEVEQQGELFKLTTFYCHPQGIGRFIMGLPGEVEIMNDPALTQYIKECTQNQLKINYL